MSLNSVGIRGLVIKGARTLLYISSFCRLIPTKHYWLRMEEDRMVFSSTTVADWILSQWRVLATTSMSRYTWSIHWQAKPIHQKLLVKTLLAHPGTPLYIICLVSAVIFNGKKLLCNEEGCRDGKS